METILRKRDVAQILQTEVNNNSAFKDVAEMLADRQRNRSKLSVKGLVLSMKKRGIDYPDSSYENVIKTLAAAGVGQLVSKKGKPVALVDIKVSLLSVGQLALARTAQMVPFERVEKISFQELEKPPEPKLPDMAVIPSGTRSYPIFLTAIIDGRPVVFPGSANIQPGSLGNFLVQFNNLVKKSTV